MLSPCVKNCTLNEEDVCVGCGRKLDEIMSWTSYTDQQRKVLLETCKKRKEALLEKVTWLKSNASIDDKKK